MIEISENNKVLFNRLKIVQPEAYYHSIRVKTLTLSLLEYINKNIEATFTQNEIDTICKGALLHDIGKIYIKNAILTKKYPLSAEEKEHISTHTQKGYDAIKDNLDKNEKEIISNICLYHHERVDGGGVKKMTLLPYYVHVVAICDCYDALTSDRVYRKAIKPKIALEMIKNCECGVFLEELIECFEKIILFDMDE